MSTRKRNIRNKRNNRIQYRAPRRSMLRMLRMAVLVS